MQGYCISCHQVVQPEYVGTPFKTGFFKHKTPLCICSGCQEHRFPGLPSPTDTPARMNATN